VMAITSAEPTVRHGEGCPRLSDSVSQITQPRFVPGLHFHLSRLVSGGGRVRHAK
jgi:hypothetical protein